ncbi:MAG: hypothetical protein OXT73_01720 [Bacteroidota bacterium]|nr:hypothetical protein [Bacteroidota bacterium]
MYDPVSIINVLSKVARQWLDPDYGVREDAIERSLEADNRFTEAALNFAINQQMALLTSEALQAWQTELGWQPNESVAVLNPGNIPFVELQDLVAVLLSGRRYFGTVSSKSPALLPAFASDMLSLVPDLPLDLVDFEEAVGSADRVWASGSDETMDWVREQAAEYGIEEERCWLRGHRFSVSVLNGQESSEDLVDLAEDVLLHEGLGCRNVSIIFAPESLSIDPVLEAMATFRGMFEAHERTAGQLKMQQALLQAVDVPHAWADGHQFLISRGEAEVQAPGHVRWVPYTDRSQAETWISAQASTIQAVFSIMRELKVPCPVEHLGQAQRPSLTWAPDGRSHSSVLGHNDLSRGV